MAIFDFQDIFQESETLLTEKCPHAFPSSFLFYGKSIMYSSPGI